MLAMPRIFFPEPDAFSIFSQDNSSYWLLLFVHSEFIHSFRSVYYLGVIFEAFFLLSGLFLHGRGVQLAWRHRILHPNCLALVGNFFVSFQAGSISRIALILYETGVILWSDIGSTPIPALAIVRQYGVTHAFGLLVVCSIERVLATFHVADYEMRPRLYIAIVIAVTSDCVILSMCYTFVTGILNGYIFTVLSYLPNFGCALILRQMLTRNKKRLARLSDSLRRYPNDKYSLSVRVQLKENIWSLEKIEFGVVFGLIALVLSLIVWFGPIFLLRMPEQMAALQWCTWAGNIAVALIIAGLAPVGYFAIALHTGQRPFYVRWYLRKFRKEEIVSPTEVKETDAYFGQLHDQWAYAMSKD
ncbi:hypothetical protein PENTCL1PPCAC_14223, partial [Pristionchus entomophagus]